jgi:hypothetical protein
LAAAETADVIEECEAIERNAQAGVKPDRSKTSQYEKGLAKRGWTEKPRVQRIAERQYARKIEALMPPTTQVDIVAVEATEAGRAQTRATGLEIEPRIDFPDAVRRRMDLYVPPRGGDRIKGSFKPDSIDQLGGNTYRFTDHKDVSTIWENSYFSSEKALPKINDLLDRNLRIAEALGPNCKGFLFTTESEELADLIQQQIRERFGPKEKRLSVLLLGEHK